ncbi:uncharacterized protein UMAG_04217 [Mycosarcoma maydis]|uniref:Altered inheritance of mitochondria protein 41 n=1 Tax=Mycosarcoma maydis TaxID=5270 RepID=A0A0D1C1J6_MYCMD|nr:uncharacterized protein UMAG_04217 [Ustilago maydis 521]KIS67717.1 hypothetical protein UMAG_04217 [Ustilago maydis 521]|eukprot:XP_011390698.1 hypothetical protein UMAG_04217 [Ustilago maydis 521]
MLLRQALRNNYALRTQLPRSLEAGSLRTSNAPTAQPSWSRFSSSEAATSGAEDSEALLLAKVKSGIKEAMKAKDSLTSTVLRSIVSELQYSSKQKGNQVSKVSKLITKAIKRRHETAKQFRAAKPPREDLAQQEEMEAAVLEKFLPEAK